MAQAIPISHQQKIAATATTVVGNNRWTASTSQPPQASSQESSSHHSQQSRSEMTENAPSFHMDTVFLHSTFPAATSTAQSSAIFDRNRISSATIPRQQQKHQQPSIAQQDVSNVTTSVNGTVSAQENHSENSIGRRRSSYETTSITVQQKQFTRDPNVGPVSETSTATTKPIADHFQHAAMLSGPSASAAPSTTMVILNADSVITTNAEEDGSTTVTITGLGGTVRSSPMSDSKWTSFDDSEGDGDEASSRHHSESEHQNLLADIDATSDGGDDTTTLTGSMVVIDDEDASLAVTPQLRSYYENCFEKLRQEIVADGVSNDLPSKGHDTTDNCSSPPVAASSPAAMTSSAIGATPMAVWGKHPRVKEFFERSNLDKSELGQIWALADVNTDGWLNVDEFCVAMHLVVRRVQAGLPIPPLLPAYLRPPITPPISSPCPMPTSAIGGYGSGGFWAQFGAQSMNPADPTLQLAKSNVTATEASHAPIDVLGTTTTALNFGPVATTTASTATTNDPQNALSPAPVVLKHFTNVPPTAAFTNVAQPKPRRVTPEFVKNQERQPQPQPQQQPQPPTSLSRPTSSHHSSSAPPSGSKFSAAPLPAPRVRTSTNDSILSNQQKAGSKSPSQVLASPQGPPPATVPKGPPPKPPPRPAVSATGAAGHRHSRSVSLDLSKKMTDMQQQFTAANISYQQPTGGVSTHDYVSPASITEIPPISHVTETFPSKRDLRDAQVQTTPVQESMDDAQKSTSNKSKRNSTAPMLDLSLDLGDETPRAIGSDTNKTPPPRQNSLQAASAAGDVGAESTVDDLKDWTKRCERLRRLNADLERDLRKLKEVKTGLEMHLKRLEKL